MTTKILITNSDIVGLATACFLCKDKEIQLQIIVNNNQKYYRNENNFMMNSLTFQYFSTLGFADKIRQNSITIKKMGISTKQKLILQTNLQKGPSKKSKYKGFYIIPIESILQILTQFLTQRPNVRLCQQTQIITVKQQQKGYKVSLKHKYNVKQQRYYNYIIRTLPQNQKQDNCFKQIGQPIQSKGYSCLAKVQQYNIESIKIIIDEMTFVILIPEEKDIVRIKSNNPNYLKLLEQVKRIKIIQILKNFEPFQVEHKDIQNLNQTNLLRIGLASHIQPSICDRDINLGIQQSFFIANNVNNKTLAEIFWKYQEKNIKTSVQKMYQLSKKAFAIDVKQIGVILPFLGPLLKAKINTQILPFFSGIGRNVDIPAAKL